MRNAGLEEAQAGIKISGRNISNLRYADDTTLMAESEEELKSLLMKEESQKVGLISPTIRKKTRVTTLTTSIQHSFGSVGHSNQGRKRSKRNPDRKRRSETLTVCR